MPRSIEQDEQAVERFVREAVATETVWGIRTSNGFAVLPADSEYATTAILFWSSEGEAVQAAAQFNAGGTAVDRLTHSRSETVRGSDYQGGQAAGIPLFDFLYRWLANMPRDFACAGPNWAVPDLVGLSVRCSELSRRLEEQLAGTGQLTTYRERYEREQGRA